MPPSRLPDAEAHCVELAAQIQPAEALRYD